MRLCKLESRVGRLTERWKEDKTLSWLRVGEEGALLQFQFGSETDMLILHRDRRRACTVILPPTLSWTSLWLSGNGPVPTTPLPGPPGTASVSIAISTTAAPPSQNPFLSSLGCSLVIARLEPRSTTKSHHTTNSCGRFTGEGGGEKGVQRLPLETRSGRKRYLRNGQSLLLLGYLAHAPAPRESSANWCSWGRLLSGPWAGQ